MKQEEWPKKVYKEGQKIETKCLSCKKMVKIVPIKFGTNRLTARCPECGGSALNERVWK